MIYARTEFGHMMDFIKANPSVTKYAYMWEWTVPQIKLACADNTHVKYLSEEEAEMRKAQMYDGNNMGGFSDLGVPIFGEENK